MSETIHPDLSYNGLLCRYNEIATKGKNRLAFEGILISSLLRTLAPLGTLKVIRERGRIFIKPPAGRDVFTLEDCITMRERLPWVPGLASASPGFLMKPDIDTAEAVLYNTFGTVYDTFCSAMPGNSEIPYRTRVHRNDKSLPFSANDIERQLAEELLPLYPRLKVSLKKPVLTVELEIRKRRAFVSYERIVGPGGLPAGSSGSVLALLSGGIDSPVACYQMIRRGCKVNYLTFHSEPYTPPALITKVAALARVLNRYQPAGKLIACNLLAAQRAVRDECTDRFRTILYRRFMVRIAAIIADCLGDRALVTGDNIGQVASQTLPNLSVVNAASPLLVLRPVLTADKQETTAMARKIGTYEVSVDEVPDSCTVFAPQSPATVTFLDRIQQEEAHLDVHGLARECIRDTALIDLETCERQPLPGNTEGALQSLSEQLKNASG